MPVGMRPMIYSSRGKNFSILPALICAIGLWAAVAHSAYLFEDEIPGPRREIEEPAKVKPAGEFPPHVVTNIKAQPVANVKGAIRISWKRDPSSPDDFIVGRSTAPIDTRDRALAAKSVQIVSPGSQSMVIDSNLPPGEYFYVVLSKEKVMSKDVEIYPDVNYTTRPVILEKEPAAKPVQSLPPQVTLLHGQTVNRTQVLLSWQGIDSRGTSYVVYRGLQALSTPDKIRRAERIAVITDGQQSYTDNGLKNSGVYYYAVTTRDAEGNEDLKLVPDQSYMTEGVAVEFISQITVTNLRAEALADSSVRLRWQGIKHPASEYLIFRHNKPILSTERLALATPVGKQRIRESSYIDEEPGPGSHYYAVLVRLEDLTIDNTLKEGENLTTSPVIVGARETAVEPRREPPKTIERIEPKKEEPPVAEDETVDRILKKTFFKGEYAFAIKMLRNRIAATDNERERAKAGLFIGRSLVELKKYRESLAYFARPEVKRHFARDARFWREYAISRFKGK